MLGFALCDFTFWSNQELNFLLSNLQKTIPQAQAVELSVKWNIDEILANTPLLQKYNYRSFHLPQDNYNQWVNELNKHQDKLQLNNLVIHPDVVTDWSILSKSKIPVLIENMDKDKTDFRTVEKIEGLLQKFPQFKLCLDICHLEEQFPCKTDHWLKKFENQIAEIHLATPGDHYPEKFTNEEIRHSSCLYDKNILNGLDIKNYPIILEGVIPPDRWDLVKEEFELVQSHL